MGDIISFCIPFRAASSSFHGLKLLYIDNIIKNSDSVNRHTQACAEKKTHTTSRGKNTTKLLIIATTILANQRRTTNKRTNEEQS